MTGRPVSLQRRLFLWVLSTVALVWVGSAITTWRDARHELEELLDSHLAQAAALLIAQQQRDKDDDDDDNAAIDAPILHRYAPRVAFQLFHQGRLILRSANAPSSPMRRVGSSFRPGFDTLVIEGNEWRVFSALGAERDVQVYMGEHSDSRADILWAVLRSTLWPTLIGLPPLALLIWWAVRRGFAPLRELGQQLGQRDPHAQEAVTVAGASRELLPLMMALNRLFERIARSLESERRFTADAAHELRTPIAAIRAQAQVAMAESDSATRKRALQNTLDGCDRATRLVEQLLTLARLEAAPGIDMDSVDVAQLCQRVVAELAPRAVSKRQTIAFEPTVWMQISGNRVLLEVLVRNLIDNAIRYSPSGATVAVRLQRIDSRPCLLIEDSGPGLAEAERERLGERFFRLAGNQESGSGLGWSIVRRIATVHHLEVTVAESGEFGGLAVRVWLPQTGARPRAEPSVSDV